MNSKDSKPVMITGKDTIHDIVTRYPVLKDVLKELSPRYEKLNNPVIFNTVARVTTVARAAQVGGLYVNDMLYAINKALGLGPEYLAHVKADAFAAHASTKKPAAKPAPAWLDKTGGFETIDAAALGGEPFAFVTEKAAELPAGQGFKLLQKFEPTPLIGYLETQGYESWSEKQSDDKWTVTFYRVKKEA